MIVVYCGIYFDASKKEVHFRGIHGGKSGFFDILTIIALQDLFLRYPGREIQLRGIQGGKFCKAYKEDIFYLRHSGRESWLERNSIMRHPGRKVLLSTQGGHFSFEAFREAKES